MRRKRLLLATIAAAVVTACATAYPTDVADQPAWLQAMIAQIRSEPVTNPPSSIIRYRYNGATVYYRPARCCDIFAELYDATGNLICHPDGGLAGNGDGKCPDFAAARTEERVIWADARR